MMMKTAIRHWRARIYQNEYEATRWLVMTAVALGAFLGFQFIDYYVFGP
jgi:hypothetical protein